MDLAPGMQYCEHCGAHRIAGGPHLEVHVDEARFRTLDMSAVAFPVGRAVVRIALGPRGLTIGRRRDGEPTPDVDLSGPLSDPAVSHHHARIEPDGVGGWRIVDARSTNGTVVDNWGPLADGDVVPLHDGSRVHIGAWTTIVVRDAGPADRR
jgi:predicted component of type VI protein secretion system